ncbi:MAG TPA: hypothetical protein VMR70_07555 [Flavisolibacter sp.]|nr:hypothetical protein [Flavisolibacter sp.]
MKLHEAIEKLLLTAGRPMLTSEIADALNQNKWYQKKDGSPIDPFQVHGRTKNYAHLFNRNGSTVSLIGQPPNKQPASKAEKVKQALKLMTPISSNSVSNTKLLEKILMNEENFRPASIIDNIVPDKAGLYCIRISNTNKLPAPFDKLLAVREHNIIYIGIASSSLKRRFLCQELRAIGHGTFFRSIGAVLGYRPIQGSLREKLNKRNYTFSPTDETKIIGWINKHLIVNWVETDIDFDTLETTLLSKYRPLLNLAKNPAALAELTKLRAECVTIANCP